MSSGISLTAFGAAIGYDWLYGSLTDDERELVAHAIVEKAIQPGLDQFGFGECDLAELAACPRWIVES